MNLGPGALRLVVFVACLQAATTKDINSLIQSVEFSPTRYLLELGGEGGKNFQYSKQSDHASRPGSKWTQTNHKELPEKLQVTTKPVWGVTADQHCFDFHLPINFIQLHLKWWSCKDGD